MPGLITATLHHRQAVLNPTQHSAHSNLGPGDLPRQASVNHFTSHFCIVDTKLLFKFQIYFFRSMKIPQMQPDGAPLPSCPRLRLSCVFLPPATEFCM